jgi:putative membrane protein
MGFGMNIRKLLVALLIIYALVTLGIQILMLVAGHIPPLLTPLTTLLGFSIALLHASERMNWKRTLWMLGTSFVISLTFECVGVATGVVYGSYHYTDKLGFLFLGLVPLLIPVAWFMMMYPSFVIADWVVPAKSIWRPVLVAAVGAVIMTAWDVVMDPMMVKGGHWVWEVNGPYFGIPLQNFSGWWLTTFVTFAVFLWLGKPVFPDHSDSKFDRLAILLFVITSLGSISAALIGGLGGAALAGFFAIFPWMLFGWMRMEGK